MIRFVQAWDHVERLATASEGGGDAQGAADHALPSQQEMAEVVASFGAHPAGQLTALLGGFGASGCGAVGFACLPDMRTGSSNKHRVHTRASTGVLAVKRGIISMGCNCWRHE